MTTEQEIRMLFSELDKTIEQEIKSIEDSEERARERARKKGTTFDKTRYSKRKQALKTMKSSLDMLNNYSNFSIDFNNKIYTMLDKLSRLYSESSNTFSPLEAFRREIDIIKREELKKITEQIRICRNSIHYNNSIIARMTQPSQNLHYPVRTKRLEDGVLVDGAAISYERAIDRLEHLLMRNSRFYNLLSDKELGNDKVVGKAKSYSRELSIIDRYLSDKSIERVKKAPNGFMGRLKGFVNGESINTGRDAIIEFNKCEEKINQIELILNEFKNNSISVDTNAFKNTYNELVKLLNIEKQNMIKAQQSFENSDYKLIQQAVMEHHKKDNKNDTINDYAKLSSQLEYLRENDPKNKEEIYRLENELMELTRNMTDEEIRIATNEGKTLTMKRNDSDLRKKDEERTEKRTEEKERLSSRQAKVEPQARVQSDSTSYEERSFNRAKKAFEKTIEERRRLDKGIVNQAVSDITTTEYYESTIGMSREARALNTLISTGKLEPGTKLEELTPFQRDMLAAQMRLEQNISLSLESYAEAKRQYEAYMERVRAEKVGNISLETNQEGIHR